MKAIRFLLAAAAGLWAVSASAQGSYSFGANVNQTIPDANPSGMTIATNLSGISGVITNISLSLNIASAPGSTAYNGDLYAYLAGPNGGFAILLNRVGVSGTSAFGYSDAGFNVTFALTGLDIHSYRNDSPQFVGGQLTQTWLPDGRAIDPQSPGSLFNSTTPTALLDSFLNTDPNGTWVLFFADLAGGNVSTVQNWTLNLDTAVVPEPSVAVLMLAGGAALLIRRLRA